MRLAISGSHLVGKTTLAETLADRLPGYDLVPEPYRQLEDEGYAFRAMPTLEEFEAQLERSCRCILEGGASVIFERSPLDIVGYLLTHRDGDSFRIEDWMAGVREAVARLDLIAFVPIETPDRIAVPRSQIALRAEVDAILREIILDDEYGLEPRVITVQGTLEARVRTILSRVGDG